MRSEEEIIERKKTVEERNWRYEFAAQRKIRDKGMVMFFEDLLDDSVDEDRIERVSSRENYDDDWNYLHDQGYLIGFYWSKEWPHPYGERYS